MQSIASAEGVSAPDGLVLTEFPNRFARRKTERIVPFDRLVEELRHPGEYDSKEAMPYFKLARFGDKRTDKGCYRNDENVVELTGVLIDYDDEQVSIEDAAQKLQQQVRAVLYTSASQTETSHRWRIVVPLAASVEGTAEEIKAAHVQLVDQIQALIPEASFANESRRLSQSYKFGVTEDSREHYRVIETHGPLLEANHTRAPLPQSSKKLDFPREDDKDHYHKILTGENYHDSLVVMAARLVERGTDRTTIIHALEGFMEGAPDRSSRWRDRYRDIRRIIDSAIEKYSAPQEPALPWPVVPLNDIKTMELPPRLPVCGPILSSSITVIAAERGTGKTMLATDIGDHIASGKDFNNWLVPEPGRVLMLQMDMPIQAAQKRAQGRDWHPDFHYVTRYQFKQAGITPPDFNDPHRYDEIFDQLSGYSTVIVDTRRTAFQPRDNASNMWSPEYWLKSQEIRHRLVDEGVALVLLDHLTKDGQIKDTKAIEDDVDTIITLKDSDKGVEDLCIQVELSKDRDGVGSGTEFFEYSDETGWRQFTVDDREQQIADFAAKKGNKAAAEKFKVSERSVTTYKRNCNRRERERRQAQSESSATGD